MKTRSIVALPRQRRAGSGPPLHFLHLPKTGGTAVKAALAGHEKAGAFALHLHRHGTTLADVPEGEAFFFAVRDPVERFVSAFLSRQRQGRPRYDRPWTPEERPVFERFASANDLAEALDGEDAATRDEAASAMRAVRHLRPYANWLGGEALLRHRADDLVLVLFQEQLDADFRLLDRYLRLDARLPQDDVGAHRNPAGVDRSLSLRARRNLTAWYDEDVRLIELCRRLPQRARDA